ncbi:aminotransferase DegT, partial [Pseudomonas sp. GW247-3R2A]
PSVVHYPIPLNKQPAVADPEAVLLIGDRIAGEVLSLPMHPYLSDVEQQHIVATLRDV